ncbi:MAG TPA: YccF domain-containing protein [Microbacteriaceae bacterium]|nr:YccF domain-containing protein [Microbacteriaceae bacterium]
MRTILNIIWLVLSGFWLFLGYMAAGIVLCILIVTIPWGIASFRIGVYALWPFGRQVESKPTSGVWSFLGNVVWFILAGWWLALAHIVSGIALCVTIIGIPLGIADFKMVPVSLMPLGKVIVERSGTYI